jgi:hypothetical protein
MLPSCTSSRATPCFAVRLRQRLCGPAAAPSIGLGWFSMLSLPVVQHMQSHAAHRSCSIGPLDAVHILSTVAAILFAIASTRCSICAVAGTLFTLIGSDRLDVVHTVVRRLDAVLMLFFYTMCLHPHTPSRSCHAECGLRLPPRGCVYYGFCLMRCSFCSRHVSCMFVCSCLFLSFVTFSCIYPACVCVFCNVSCICCCCSLFAFNSLAASREYETCCVRWVCRACCSAPPSP